MGQNYRFDILKLSYRSPLLSGIVKQIIFWIIAYALLCFIIYITTASNFSYLGIYLNINFFYLFLLILITSFIFGISLGLTDYFLNKKIFLNSSLGRAVLSGGIIYFLLLMGILPILKYIITFFLEVILTDISLGTYLEDSWIYHYYIILVYTFFMTIILSFLNLLDNKFGPGHLIPLLLGKYRFPQEEERVFMFLDLNASTTLAEELGHIKYSMLIQECFLDINRMVRKYNAEIYQYVGDQIVISWPLESLKGFGPTEFYFSVQKNLINKREFYQRKFGIIPSFKAGVHLGLVTKVEVGDVKRDIAYHGDTLNVAARLEGLCSQLNQSIIVSSIFRERGKLNDKYLTTSFGVKTLKGREARLEVFGITPAVIL